MTTAAQLRRLAVASVLVLAALFAAACGSDSDGDGGSTAATTAGGGATTASEPVKVRIAAITSAGQGDIPTILQEQGIAARHGLEIEVVEISQTGQQWTALRGGSADVATGSVLDLLRQRRAGLRARGLTAFQTFSNPIVVPADSPIRSFADLRGKKLATPGAGIFDFQIVRAAGKQADGLDVGTDTKVTEAAPPLINRLLDRGAVDAALQFSSLALAPLTDGRYRKLTDLPQLLQSGGFDDQSFYLLYSVTDEWADEHPDKVPELAAAIREAVDLLETDDSVWAPLAARVGVTDPRLLSAYIASGRASLRAAYDERLVHPTQELFDAVARTVGAEQLGVTRVDPSAFVFGANG